jgi:two-component system sensor histidine kinase BaeS
VRTLAGRISVLSVGVAVLTALLAGALALGLGHNSGAGAARRNLGRLADVTQTAVDNGGGVPRPRVVKALAGLNVRSGVIRPNGRLFAGNALVTAAVTSDDIAAVLAGQDVSASRSARGTTVFVEARPVGRGGIVLVQKRADAVAPEKRALRRTAAALGIAGVLAAVLGLLVAWRLARPLRRTAAAAHALAGGHRDVALPAEGPAEVVEVSDAINSLAGALRHSEARQRQFLLSVSHDLRTPLTAITGYAESLAEGVVPPEEAPRVGGVVLGEARRLDRLVGDLLDLARRST